MKKIFLFLLIALLALTAVFAAESAYSPGVKPDTVQVNGVIPDTIQVNEVSFFADNLLFIESRYTEMMLYCPEIKVAVFNLNEITFTAFVPDIREEAFILREA